MKPQMVAALAARLGRCAVCGCKLITGEGYVNECPPWMCKRQFVSDGYTEDILRAAESAEQELIAWKAECVVGGPHAVLGDRPGWSR